MQTAAGQGMSSGGKGRGEGWVKVSIRMWTENIGDFNPIVTNWCELSPSNGNKNPKVKSIKTKKKYQKDERLKRTRHEVNRPSWGKTSTIIVERQRKKPLNWAKASRRMTSIYPVKASGISETYNVPIYICTINSKSALAQKLNQSN